MIQVILGHDGVRWRKGSTENHLPGGSVPLGQEGACGPLSQTRWRASRPGGQSLLSSGQSSQDSSSQGLLPSGQSILLFPEYTHPSHKWRRGQLIEAVRASARKQEIGWERPGPTSCCHVGTVGPLAPDDTSASGDPRLAARGSSPGLEASPLSSLGSGRSGN